MGIIMMIRTRGERERQRRTDIEMCGHEGPFVELHRVWLSQFACLLGFPLPAREAKGRDFELSLALLVEAVSRLASLGGGRERGSDVPTSSVHALPCSLVHGSLQQHWGATAKRRMAGLPRCVPLAAVIRRYAGQERDCHCRRCGQLLPGGVVARGFTCAASDLGQWVRRVTIGHG